MTEQDIHNLLAAGERVTLECKKAQSSLPNSMWDTYSAFANTYGGTILLGVYEDTKEKDKVKRFTITGVDDAAKIRIDLWNTVNSREKVNINLLHDEDVQTVKVDDRDVIAIHVPRAEYNLRPIYINNNPMRGTYCRNHEGDYRNPIIAGAMKTLGYVNMYNRGIVSLNMNCNIMGIHQQNLM